MKDRGQPTKEDKPLCENQEEPLLQGLPIVWFFAGIITGISLCQFVL